MDKIGISLGYFLVQLFNFGILFIVILAWVVKPVREMLERRKETFRQGLEDARMASEARANAEHEADRIITEAQKKASEIIQEANDRAEDIKRDIEVTAHEEIAKERDEMRIEMDVEKRHMLTKLRSKVIMLAIASAKHLVGEELVGNEARQHQLLNTFFSGIKDGKVVVLDTEVLSGTSASVTSAVILTDEEREAVEQYLLPYLGENMAVEYKVDASILGGLIVRVGDHVVDGSVAGKLRELQHELN